MMTSGRPNGQIRLACDLPARHGMLADRSGPKYGGSLLLKLTAKRQTLPPLAATARRLGPRTLTWRPPTRQAHPAGPPAPIPAAALESSFSGRRPE